MKMIGSCFPGAPERMSRKRRARKQHATRGDE